MWKRCCWGKNLHVGVGPAYAEGSIAELTNFSVFWWFPIGTTGIRALLLFLSPLAIFVLRVAQLHFEAFSTKSPFETLTKRLVRLEVLQTFAWYLFSAWWFGEVYIWSASDGANLGWIAEGK